MKITPALPNPYPPSFEQDRRQVGTVRAPSPARDPVDPPAQQQRSAMATDRLLRERMATRAEGQSAGRPQTGSARVDRALASYAAVADDVERSDLRELLGFDAYA